MGSKRAIIKSKIKSGKEQDPKYLASCYGKVRHNSYEDAKATADRKPSKVRPYKCMYGGHYHIGRREP